MTCERCGHQGCDGRECKDPQFLLSNGDYDCAICCREQVVRVFAVIALLAMPYQPVI